MNASTDTWQDKITVRGFASYTITAFLVIAVLLLAASRLSDYREARLRDRCLMELSAADVIRDAIEHYRVRPSVGERPALNFSNIETLLRQLLSANMVDDAPVNYVLAHQARFAITIESNGLNFEARCQFDGLTDETGRFQSDRVRLSPENP